MTRVNVDDVAFMDRRFKLLGGRLAITWQEALGRCLPVWALAYAKRSAVLPPGDIDALAERAGFAEAMRDVDLALEDEHGLYLRGVADRIDFLLIQDAKREKARQAKLDAHGVASPRRPSRGTASQRAERPAATSPGTLPEEGPYSPDLDLDLAPDRDPPARARAIQPAPDPAPQPAPTTALPPSAAYDPTTPRDRGQLAEATYQRVSDARVAIAAELKLPTQLPFPPVTPSSRPRAFVELLDRVREEGSTAPLACDRVVGNLIAQARETRDVEWLSQKAFGAGAWATARERTGPRRARGAKGEAIAAARPELEKRAPIVVPAAERAIAAGMATEALVKLFGTSDARAGPGGSLASTTEDESTDTDDQEQA